MVREVGEELGFQLEDGEVEKPFLVTKTRTTDPNKVCEWHFDIWYVVKTDGSRFNLTDDEFSDPVWVTVGEARKRVTDQGTICVLDVLEGEGGE